MYFYNNYFHFYTPFILDFHYFRQRKGYKSETVIKIWMAVTVVKLGGKYYFKSFKINLKTFSFQWKLRPCATTSQVLMRV